MAHAAPRLIRLAQELAGALDGLRFQAPVTHVYNPLRYAWAPHETYLRQFGGPPKRVVFVGMNPGPFGMVQTGVPFGEIAAVRDWMGIEEPVGQPPRLHPKRPVDGFACRRSEISGQRLWGLFAQRFGTADRFFADHLVVNYCPLAFFDAGGRNVTPDKLAPTNSAELLAVCDDHLRQVVAVVRPQWVIGVGAFAEQRAREALVGRELRLGRILHPSPASPAANRDWAGATGRRLGELGVWP